MNEPDLLNELRRLKGALPRAASDRVEQKLLAAVRRRQSRQNRLWPYAAIAAVLLIAFLIFRPGKPSSDLIYRAPGFIALPYAQSGVPLEQAIVVRVRLNSSQLASLGVPVSAGDFKTVNADLLVGQDGVARAVRLVH